MSRGLFRYLPRQNLRGIPQRSPESAPSGTLWPTGEFSYGFVRPRPDDDERLTEVSYCPRGDEWMFGMSDGAEPLNLSDVPNSHKPRKRGMKGITGYGKNMVKSAGALINRYYPNHRVTFCTVTLPEMTAEQRRESVVQWPAFLRELIQWVGRKLERQGLPKVVVAVTEIQPERLRETGQGMLHVHLLWLNIPAKNGHWAIDPNNLRSWVANFWRRRVGLGSEAWFNVNVKKVTGEVARYMAKYMSKGGQVLDEACADWGEEVCPSTWWNMAADTRRWVKDHVSKGAIVGSLLDSLVNYGWCVGPDELFAFLAHVEVDFDGVLVTMGWRGRLHPPVYQSVAAMIESTR